MVVERENAGCWPGIEFSDSGCSVQSSVPGVTAFSKLAGIKDVNVAGIPGSGAMTSCCLQHCQGAALSQETANLPTRGLSIPDLGDFPLEGPESLRRPQALQKWSWVVRMSLCPSGLSSESSVPLSASC